MRSAKLLFIAITFAMFTFSICAQSVVITKRTVTYRRPKPQMDFKRTFVINYPKVKAASPSVAAKIEQQMNYFKAFRFTLREEMNDIQWLEEADFEVDHNANRILAVALSINGSAAYPDGSTKHIVIDSTTGTRITPSTVFTNLSGLAQLANRRLQSEIADAKKAIKQDKEIGDVDAEELFDRKKFGTVELNAFSVSKDGVTFFYDYGFPHVIEALQPEGEFKFSWAELRPYVKPGGLLASFVR